MIKNDYKEFENYAIIYCKRRDGEEFEIIVDIDDLKVIDVWDCKVYVVYSKNNDAYYARITKYMANHSNVRKSRLLLLHRIIANVHNTTDVIDHINFNTLDNRKDNLRIVPLFKNSVHRKSKNSNNKSGYRNVSWNKYSNKWVVQLQVNGKNSVLGSFESIDDAQECAKQMRLKHYDEE